MNEVNEESLNLFPGEQSTLLYTTWQLNSFSLMRRMEVWTFKHLVITMVLLLADREATPSINSIHGTTSIQFQRSVLTKIN